MLLFNKAENILKLKISNCKESKKEIKENIKHAKDSAKGFEG